MCYRQIVIFIQGTIVYKIHFRQVPNFIQYLNNKQLKQGNKQKEINKRKEIKKNETNETKQKKHTFSKMLGTSWHL